MRSVPGGRRRLLTRLPGHLVDPGATRVRFAAELFG